MFKKSKSMTFAIPLWTPPPLPSKIELFSVFIFCNPCLKSDMQFHDSRCHFGNFVISNIGMHHHIFPKLAIILNRVISDFADQFELCKWHQLSNESLDLSIKDFMQIINLQYFPYHRKYSVNTTISVYQ